MDTKEAERLASVAVEAEKKLASLQEEFALSNPKFASFLKQQNLLNEQIANMWGQVKETLVQAGYTDVLENDLFRISISRVFAFTADVEKLPAEYTEVVKIPKKEKIKKHFELYETLPEGATDTSYFRLNKKVK